MLDYPNPGLMGAVMAHFRGRLVSLDAALAVAIVLHLRSEDAECWPSVAELAEILGVKRRAVLASLARLRVQRVIVAKSRRGRGQTSLYRVGDALRATLSANRESVRAKTLHSGADVAGDTCTPMHGRGARRQHGTVLARAHGSVELSLEGSREAPHSPPRGASVGEGFAAVRCGGLR